MSINKLTRISHRIVDIPNAINSKIETIPQSFKKPSLVGAMIDILYSRIRYGASIDDYFDFRFYSLNHRGRKSYGTVKDKFAIYNYVNQRDYCIRIADKNLFTQYYGAFLKRDAFLINDNASDAGLREYCHKMISDGTSKFIIKPCRGGEGIGIFILDADDPILDSVSSIQNKYNEMNKEAIKRLPHYKDALLARKELLIEPLLENHPAIKKIHPASLNTMRIPTLFTEGHFKIMGAYIRFGRNGNVVDNINAGGMTAEIDLETGVIMTAAADHAGRQYIVHPTTGEIIVGLKIPYWEEVKEMVLKAAEVTPEVKYVGWDVAVTANGPIIIEGNTCGSLQIQQFPQHMGNRFKYEEVLRSAGKW